MQETHREDFRYLHVEVFLLEGSLPHALYCTKGNNGPRITIIQFGFKVVFVSVDHNGFPHNRIFTCQSDQTCRWNELAQADERIPIPKGQQRQFRIWHACLKFAWQLHDPTHRFTSELTDRDNHYSLNTTWHCPTELATLHLYVFRAIPYNLASSSSNETLTTPSMFALIFPRSPTWRLCTWTPNLHSCYSLLSLYPLKDDPDGSKTW